MRRSLSILTLLLCSTLFLRAQGRTQQSLDEFYSFGDNYFLEVTVLPGEHPPKERAVVSFRLSYDLLNFRKEATDQPKTSVYVSTPSLFFEAAGSDGVIAARGLWRDTVRTRDFGSTNSKTLFICGAAELALRPDVYTITYTFTDGGPESGFSETTPPIKVDDFHSPSPAVGSPLFIRSLADGAMATAAAIDGNALFGLPLRAFVPLGGADEPKDLQFNLLSMPKTKGGAFRDITSGFGRIMGRATLGSPIASGNDLLFPIRTDSTASAGAYGAMVEIPSGDLDIGDYMLLLTYRAGENSVVDSIGFKLRWIDMPVSLIRPDYAIRALYPIAVEDTIDEMLSGGADKRQAALNRFWQQRDPTPDTKYNEKMAEYYRRVDYSYFNFRNIEQKDGAHTDRGKIYILFGPPTNIQRQMQPDAPPREIWEYANQVNRRFVFADLSQSGTYKLVEYHDL